MWHTGALGTLEEAIVVLEVDGVPGGLLSSNTDQLVFAFVHCDGLQAPLLLHAAGRKSAYFHVSIISIGSKWTFGSGHGRGLHPSS
jgi:hypothetical protein